MRGLDTVLSGLDNQSIEVIWEAASANRRPVQQWTGFS
jgi:hypothetical protein